MNFYKSSWGSLTAANDLRVKRLGIVFVEDMGSNVGGVMVNHCRFRRLSVGGGGGRGQGVGGAGIEETRSQGTVGFIS